jgi:hypothetical protein
LLFNYICDGAGVLDFDILGVIEIVLLGVTVLDGKTPSEVSDGVIVGVLVADIDKLGVTLDVLDIDKLGVIDGVLEIDKLGVTLDVLDIDKLGVIDGVLVVDIDKLGVIDGVIDDVIDGVDDIDKLGVGDGPGQPFPLPSLYNQFTSA